MIFFPPFSRNLSNKLFTIAVDLLDENKISTYGAEMTENLLCCRWEGNISGFVQWFFSLSSGFSSLKVKSFF